jgi:hypothetical protein
MKKLLLILLGVFLIMPMATSAFSAGPPPKDVMKGVFLSVDDTSRTTVFKKSGSEETMQLVLGADMSPSAIRVNKKVMVSLDKHAGENVIKSIDIMFMDMTVNKIIALLVIGLIGGLLRLCSDAGHDVPGCSRSGCGCQQHVPQVPQGHGWCL